MKNYSLHAFLAIVLSSPPAIAQLINNDIAAHSMIYKYNDASKIGENKVSNDYSQVHGKYLWSNDWHRAAIIMKPGNIVKMNAVRLNFYTNEVHYPGGRNDMAASIDKVKKILLYSSDPADTTFVIATFEVLPDPRTKQNVFYEVMNDGNIQLLKRVAISSNRMRIDPIQSKETFYLYSDIHYFIRNDKTLTEIRKLRKSTVFEAVPIALTGKEWLETYKNNLKTEKEVADFLSYLCTRNK